MAKRCDSWHLTNDLATAGCGCKRVCLISAASVPMPLQVVFQFGGQVHEVHLPAASYHTQADAAGHFVREEAATVLQCLTGK